MLNGANLYRKYKRINYLLITKIKPNEKLYMIVYDLYEDEILNKC